MAFPAKLGLLVLFAANGLTPSLNAQGVVSARAGLITYVQGPTFVDGRRVFLKTARFPQMKNGEILSTGLGRAELLLAPGAVLRLSENSRMRIEDTQLANTRVTLLRGDALIEVVQLAEGARVQVAFGEITTELLRSGLYRFGIAQNGTGPNTLKVYAGEASVHAGPATADLKRGMAVELSPGLVLTKFDRKQTDSLHAWSARRSFDLFMGDPGAREKQTHWQPNGGGYVENKNFGVEFRAAIRRRTMPPSAVPPIPQAQQR